MEVWQAAAALGVSQPGQERDFVAERIRHARGQGPKPEVEPTDDSFVREAQRHIR